MHFCQDELFALMALMPGLTAALGWCRGRFFRKTTPSLPRGASSPYRVAYRPEPKLLTLKERVQNFFGPVWPLW